MNRTEDRAYSPQQANRADIAIITALEVERNAVNDVFGIRSSSKTIVGNRVYWIGTFDRPDESQYRVAVTQQVEMANVHAAVLATQIFADWSPQVILMVGIAGSLDKDVEIGDVVCARDVYYYERGKAADEGMLSEPVMLRSDALLTAIAQSLDWTLPSIDQPPPKARAIPSIHHGVIASGEKVVANKDTKKRILEQHRKALAVEMEGYGVAAAVYQTEPKPRHLIIRGISDRADRRKSNKAQPYAARAAAGFAVLVITELPISPYTAAAVLPTADSTDTKALGPRMADKLIQDLRFLAFFPDGLPAAFLEGLASVLDLAQSFAEALDTNLLRRDVTNGVAIIRVSPPFIRLFAPADSTSADYARSTFEAIRATLQHVNPFQGAPALGPVQGALLRDLLRLSQTTIEETDAVDFQSDLCDIAREHLGQLASDGEVALALQVSEALRLVDSPTTVRGDLTHAHLLLQAGDARAAAALFSVHMGEDVCGECNLSLLERLEFGLDWLRALKQSGRGRSMHGQIMDHYDRLLALINELESQAGKQEAVAALRAVALHNQATQASVFGSRLEREQAQSTFQRAAGLLPQGQATRQLAMVAGRVAHLLDLEGKDAPLAELRLELDSLVGVADSARPDENLFFYYYQSARLYRYAGEATERIVTEYQAAAEVASQSETPHRAAIAEYWVATLQYHNRRMSEGDYLDALSSIVRRLEAVRHDAWSANVLRRCYSDLAQLRLTRREYENAWESVVAGLEIEVRWTARGATSLALTLRVLRDLPVATERKDALVRGFSSILRPLIGGPEWAPVSLPEVYRWLTSVAKGE